MKLKFQDMDRRTPVAAHALCEAFAGLLHGFVRSPDGLLDIVFTVNGVEGDFEKVLKRFEEHFDEAVEKRAVELVNERQDVAFEDLLETIGEISRGLRAKTRELFPKSFRPGCDGEDCPAGFIGDRWK
jgi:hypothetical protein